VFAEFLKLTSTFKWLYCHMKLTFGTFNRFIFYEIDNTLDYEVTCESPGLHCQNIAHKYLYFSAISSPLQRVGLYLYLMRNMTESISLGIL
jgi:hypothetical protein